MSKLSKSELIEKILDLGVDTELDTHIWSQEFIVTQLRMIEEPSEADMVETQNNAELLDYMNTEKYKESFRQIFREEYEHLDVKSLEFILKALEVSSKIREVEKRSHARIEEAINKLDFLLEVEEDVEEKPSTPKTLH